MGAEFNTLTIPKIGSLCVCVCHRPLLTLSTRFLYHESNPKRVLTMFDDLKMKDRTGKYSARKHPCLPNRQWLK